MRAAATAAALALASGLADGAAAQADPPSEKPSGATYPSSSVSFPSSALGFPGGAVGYPSAAIGYPAAALAFPRATLAFPSAALALPSAAVAAPAGSLASNAMSMREEKGGLRFTLNADLLFDFDKADLRPAADGVLRGLVAETGRRLPGGRFRVEGHTDAKGNDRYNDALSARRAKSVQMWLARSGSVPAGRIATTGFGKRRPVAPNARPDGSDDPDGRQKNRRVEILVTP